MPPVIGSSSTPCRPEAERNAFGIRPKKLPTPMAGSSTLPPLKPSAGECGPHRPHDLRACIVRIAGRSCRRLQLVRDNNSSNSCPSLSQPFENVPSDRRNACGRPPQPTHRARADCSSRVGCSRDSSICLRIWIAETLSRNLPFDRKPPSSVSPPTLSSRAIEKSEAVSWAGRPPDGSLSPSRAGLAATSDGDGSRPATSPATGCPASRSASIPPG